MKRWILFALAAALLVTLTACMPTGNTDPPPAESTEPADAPPATPSGDDFAFAVAGVPGGQTLFSVDGSPITAEIYLYWLSYTASYYESYLQNYGQTMDWEESVDGQTLGEFLKLDAAETAKFYQLLADKAAQYDCGLTDEQRVELETLRQDSIDSAGGQAEYEFQLRRVGISDSALTTINAAPYHYNNLLALLFGDEPTDDDLAGYVEEQGVLAAKHILIRTVDDEYAPLPEAEAADALVRAESILAEIWAADDPVSTFNDLMNQYSEDPGLASYPDGYTFGPNEMVPEFEDGTRALSVGEISPELVQSDYGYHILLRMPVAPDDDLRAQYTDSLFQAVIEEWMTNAVMDYTAEYDAIDAKTVYDAMTAYRAEVEAEYETAVK